MDLRLRSHQVLRLHRMDHLHHLGIIFHHPTLDNRAPFQCIGKMRDHAQKKTKIKLCFVFCRPPGQHFVGASGYPSGGPPRGPSPPTSHVSASHLGVPPHSIASGTTGLPSQPLNTGPSPAHSVPSGPPSGPTSGQPISHSGLSTAQPTQHATTAGIPPHTTVSPASTSGPPASFAGPSPGPPPPMHRSALQPINSPSPSHPDYLGKFASKMKFIFTIDRFRYAT